MNDKLSCKIPKNVKNVSFETKFLKNLLSECEEKSSIEKIELKDPYVDNDYSPIFKILNVQNFENLKYVRI